MTILIATFYKFFDFADYATQQQPIFQAANEQQIKGTLLLASEGINATIAGEPEAIANFLNYLKQDARLSDLTHKESLAETPPFGRLKVKLKKEIVSLGQPEANPGKQVGHYVEPKAWNQLIQDPEVALVDTRNDYEVKIGSFVGAINPQTHSFREFPEYVTKNLDPQKQKKVAMFCTGGIRCEKATAYLLSQGFEEVYHLKGGILKYLEEVVPEESLWQGECFVFDERVAVKHGLEPGSYTMCLSCGHPIDATDQATPDYEEGISCPYCVEVLTEEKRSRQIEKQRQRQQEANPEPTKKVESQNPT